MSLETRLAAAMTAIGQAVRSLALGKADDTTVVHRTGDEAVNGTKTFGTSPVVPAPSAAGHAVRHDDSRFVPGGGNSGQVLTKASAANHALAWADPPGASGGSYITGTVPAGSATVTITHNLGTRDVVVMVRETATYQYVPVANDAPTSNTVRLVFTAAPTSGQYRYVIFAALGEPVPAPAAPTAHASTHATDGSDPVSTASIGAAPADHTHPGYAAASHDHSGVYAPAQHTHPPAPVLRGPWVQTNGFLGSALAPIGDGRNTGGVLTVPALGYDWLPFASARYRGRSDVWASAPALELREGDPHYGEVYAKGLAPGTARVYEWVPAVVSPVLGPVLSGSSSHTFYLWMRPASGGGWVESVNTGNPHITVYALPV